MFSGLIDLFSCVLFGRFAGVVLDFVLCYVVVSGGVSFGWFSCDVEFVCLR